MTACSCPAADITPESNEPTPVYIYIYIYAPNRQDCFGWSCVSVQQLGELCCNDDVGLFATGTARLKLQHLQTMTLITQQKPKESDRKIH